MTTGVAATGQEVVVTFADWSTAPIPPIKTLLLKIVHNPGFPPPPEPLPASPYPAGLQFSRFDNTAAGFSKDNKDFSWFAGKTYNASGVVPAITSAYSSTSTSTFAEYGITSGYGANFALLLRGYFRPSRTGTWTFALVANDYAMMWVGAAAAAPGTSNTATNALLTTDSTNSYDASAKTSASMSLVANQYYPVLIYYGQSSGDSALSLTYRGPGVSNSSDGVGYYFYDGSWSSPYIPGAGLPSNVFLNTGTNVLRTLANGDGVADWGAFSQSVVGRQPNFYNQSSGWQNGGYVSFSNSLRKLMYTPSPVTLNIGTNGGLSYALLIRFKAVVTSEQILSSTAGSNVLSINRNTSTSTLNFTDSTVPNAVTALNTWYIFTYRLDNAATRVTIKRDNVTLLDNTSATPNTFNGSMRIGLGSTATASGQSGTLWTSADIGALILYDRALTDSEMSLLYTYVSSGYATTMSIQNPPVPSPTQSTLTLPVIAGTYTVTLDKYFVYATSYTLISNPFSSASISGSTLSIACANRNTTYTLSVSATNAIGTSGTTLSIVVTESPPPPVLTLGSTAAISISGTTTATVALSTYFMYATSYTISDPMATGAYMSGTTMYVRGGFRNTIYGIVVTASNVAGTGSALTVLVTEGSYTTQTLLTYDASTLTGASGSVVSSWPNLSSLGSDFNVTGYNSPTIIVDANGKGVDFTSSSSQRFSLSTSSTLCALDKFVQSSGGTTVYGGATVVLVVKFRGPRANYERLLSLSNTSSPNNQLIYVGRSDVTASYATDIYNGTTPINNQVFFMTKSGTTAIVEGVAQIFVTTYATTQALQHRVQHYINSSTPYEMDILSTRAYAINNRIVNSINIGASAAGTSNFTNAIIYQVMIFNEALGTAGIATIVEDLKSKWNVQTYTPPPPPELIYVSVVSKTISDLTASTFDLTAYFRFATSYTQLSNPQSSASISGSTLTINGLYRDMTYDVIVSASNAAGTSSSTVTFRITESPRLTTWHPQTVLLSNNPTYSYGGLAFTFENTNQYGQWNGSWMYDQNNGTTITMDQYSATGAFLGTRTVGGKMGQYHAIISTTPFICSGYKGILDGTNGPGTIHVIATNDSVSFTTLDTWTISSTSTFVNGYDNTGTNGINRTFANSTVYKKYYVVFTSSCNVAVFVWKEWRWYMNI
jgi:hypothetical protein